MDELIIRVLAGHASPAEVERVRLWREKSAQNETYFQQTERVWAATEPQARKVYAPPAEISGIVANDEDRAAIVLKPRRSQAWVAPWSRLGWGLALAAAVASLIVGIRVIGPGRTTELPTASFVGEADVVRTAVLEDGSFVRLSPGSRLDQWTSDGDRRFTLTGKGFFAVTHDPNRPFTVNVGGSTVRVLGTRFEIDETATEIRTVVVEGVVEVSNEYGGADVPAGSVAESPGDGAPSVSAVEDVHALLHWPGGLLMFQGTPLAQVAQEVQGYFGRVVEIRDASLGTLRISAYFDEESFDEVVEALCAVSGADCIPSAGGIAMTRAP